MKFVRASFVLWSITLPACWTASTPAQTVTFPDPNLESAIRSALSIPAEPITRSNLQQLVRLSACGANITNLSGLEWATNLTSLDLSGNLLSGLSPLAGLTQLTNLNAGDNLITSLVDLSALTQLDSLWLYGNPLQSLGPITNLTGLTSLVVYNARVADIRPLTALTNLRYLELRSNPITNVQEVLPALGNLTTLYLGGTSLSNVNFLPYLKDLTFLNLDHNQIQDLSPLIGLSALQQLDISYNPITNVVPSGPVPGLTGLYLSGLSFSNLSVLTNVTGLRSLTLCNNSITDVSPLAGLTSLRDLGLSWNQLDSLGPLSGLTNLATLWLEENSITNLNFLHGLTALRTLSLRHNRLRDLDDLGVLTNLRALLADFNRLTNIVSLQNLAGLSRGELTGNALDLSVGSPAWTTIQLLQALGASVSYLPQDEAPTISAPHFWTCATNTVASFGFQVGDDSTPGDQLVTAVSSSNPGLIPDQTISIVVSGFNRTLTFTPAPDQAGSATLTLTVTDHAGASANASVQVSVLVPQPVSIPDPSLNFAIRESLQKPNGPLTSVDLMRLTSLGVVGSKVGTLAGLEWATNLTVLYLDTTATTNLTTLLELRHLTYLSLMNNGPADFSPVAGLTNLSGLTMTGNSISNVSLLQDLTRLTYLDLTENAINDLAPLGGLTNLVYLSVADNLVTNLSPVQNLPLLTAFSVYSNVLNTAAGSSTMAAIQSLLNRGVQVTYLPQRGPPALILPPNWVIAAGEVARFHYPVQANGFSEWLTIVARSSNTNLLPDGNVLASDYGGGWWSLTVTPTGTQTGSTIITFSSTNDLGFTNRRTMPLIVAAPLAFNGQAVNSNFTWLTGANAPWFSQSTNSHDGISAVRSGAISDDMQTWLQTTVSGPGVLSFWWRVSSETNHDWLECYVDGVLQPPSISGEVDWRQREIVIPTLGTHVVRWQYAKSYRCCESGQDAAWLDQVTFDPLSWLELPAAPTNGQSQLILHPVRDRLYEVQASSNLLNWFRLAFVVPTNNPMPFVDVAAPFGQRFYRLHEFTRSSIRLEPTVQNGNQVRLVLHSPPALRFELQASTDLTDWVALTILTNTPGVVEYIDTMPANSPWRFYRARLLLP